MDNSITRALYKVALGLCFVLTISLVFIICYEVVVRSVFGRPTSWAVELSSYAFLWLALLCVAVGLAEDRHLRVEMITERLPPRLRAGLEVVTLACTMAAQFTRQSMLPYRVTASPSARSQSEESWMSHLTPATTGSAPMLLAIAAVMSPTTR